MVWLAGPVVVDDAGAYHRCAPHYLLFFDERQSDVTFGAMVHRLRRVWAMERDGIHRSLPGFVFVIGIVFTSQTALASYGAVLLACIWATISVLVWWIMRRGRAAKLVQRTSGIVLARGICPACLYSLRGLPERDGLVECSECGASWSRDRITERQAAEPCSTANPGKTTQLLRYLWLCVRAYEEHGPTKLYDDRNIEQPAVSPRLFWPMRMAKGERLDRLVAARREMLRCGRRERVQRALAVIGLTVVVFAVLLYGRTAGAVIFWGSLMLFAAGVMIVTTLRSAIGIQEHDIRTGMLNHGLCPSCSGELTDRAESDRSQFCGCSACGAAWRYLPAQTGARV